MGQGANPFYIEPATANIQPVLDGLGSLIKENREAKKKAAIEGELMAAVESGDPMQMAEISIKYPQYQEATKKAFGFANPSSEKAAMETYRRILSDPNNAELYLSEGIDRVTAAGGKPDMMTGDLEMFRANPEAALKAVKAGYAGVDGAGYKSLFGEGGTASQKKFKTAPGMPGYSFDESTGQFNIDPELKVQLDADAAALSVKPGMLKSKDIAGINDKVTGLTKESRGIYNSAKALDALKKNDSAGAKLAAVFKFMKAMDPSSTVRESEQGQVYAASGAAAQLAGMVNNLLGEGKLSDKGFQDLVDTSKVLANSAVTSAGLEVSSYLDVLSDKIDETSLTKMQARVPALFKLKQDASENKTKQQIGRFLVEEMP